VDVHLNRRFAIRTEFDLLGSFADMVESNSRLSLGAAVMLGGR
jgi:hypothetical protein